MSVPFHGNPADPFNGKPGAGNSHRHVEPAPEGIRGAFYNLLAQMDAMTPTSPPTPSEPNLSAHYGELPEPATGQRRESEPAAVEFPYDFASFGGLPCWLSNVAAHAFYGMSACVHCGMSASTFVKSGRPVCVNALGSNPVPAPDFDAILLAARKRRTAETLFEGCGRKSPKELLITAKRVRKEAENSDRANRLSRAMSTPLTFSPRIGWKPGAPSE